MPKSVPPKSVLGTNFGRKTGLLDQFWLPKSVLSGPIFWQPKLVPFAKNGPLCKTESLYPALACILIIYTATYISLQNSMQNYIEGVYILVEQIDNA